MSSRTAPAPGQDDIREFEQQVERVPQPQPRPDLKAGIVTALNVRDMNPIAPMTRPGQAGTEPGDYFADLGGPVLTNCTVVPIFWGGVWTNPTGAAPTVLQVFAGLASIVSGPYVTGLSQYRGIGPGHIFLARATRTPTEPPTYTPPKKFSSSDIETLIGNCIDAGTVPAPDSFPGGQVLYSVFLPPNVTPDPADGGAHTYFSHDGKNVHYAWIGYGTLDGITNTFSHEFAEACTDPEGSTFAFHADALPGASGWIEIGDVCEGYNGVLNGVNVQAYWSQKDRACIIPTLNIPQVPRWYPLGDSEASHGILNGGLAASTDAHGILQLFIRGGAGDILHLGQTGSTTWGIGPDAPGHYLSLGGYALPDAFSVASNPDGRLEMVAIGNGNQVSHAWQVSPGGSWTAWNPLNGQGLGVPRIVRNSAGQLEIFLVGTDSQIWHIKQTAALNWGGIWSPLGAKVATGLFVPPIMHVISNADGRIEVFYQGTDAGLWHLWQMSPNGAWSQPARIGGTISLLALARGHDGIITAFVRAAGDGGLYYIRQTAAPDWGGRFTWITGGVSGSSLTAGINEGANLTGRIEVFYVGTGSDVRHVWQTNVATPTVWASGSLGGSGIQKVHAANNADGRFELFVIASDSRPWHIWQTAPGNGWNY